VGRVAETPGAHVPEEGRHGLGILSGARHQVRQHAPPGRGEAPRRHHRLAALAGADALGGAVDEEMDDLGPAQVPRGELPALPPELPAELGDPRARPRRQPVVGAEGVLDVPHRRPSRQHVHRHPLRRLGPPVRALADLRADGLVPTGDLRRRDLGRPSSDPERLLGRKTMETGMLREALAKTQAERPRWRLPSPPQDGSR